jgi:hypothetical protein
MSFFADHATAVTPFLYFGASASALPNPSRGCGRQSGGVADDPTFWRKMERATVAFYPFLALFVSRAFATKASNRGSLGKDFNSGSRKGYDLVVHERGEAPGPYKIFIQNPHLLQVLLPVGKYFQRSHSSLSDTEREIVVNLINAKWYAAFEL